MPLGKTVQGQSHPEAEAAGRDAHRSEPYKAKMSAATVPHDRLKYVPVQGQPHPEAVAAGREAVDAWNPVAGHPHIAALRRTFTAPVCLQA